MGYGHCLLVVFDEIGRNVSKTNLQKTTSMYLRALANPMFHLAEVSNLSSCVILPRNLYVHAMILNASRYLFLPVVFGLDAHCIVLLEHCSKLHLMGLSGNAS